jgi:hypothetical protein
MRQIFARPFFLLICLLAAGCSGHARRESDLAELQRLLEQGREAHFSRNADLLVSAASDEFISVDSGEVTRPDRTSSRARFQAYFDAVEFIEWDDLEPPVIRISRDGSMAYVIVRKRVRLKVLAQNGREETSIFAWMETWEKEDGAWKRKAIASTNAEPG